MLVRLWRLMMRGEEWRPCILGRVYLGWTWDSSVKIASHCPFKLRLFEQGF